MASSRQQILARRSRQRASALGLGLAGAASPVLLGLAYGWAWLPVLIWGFGSLALGAHFFQRAGDQAVWALLARAYRRLTSGRLEAAEASLVLATQLRPKRHLARLIHLQQATIALRRGALDHSRSELDAALDLSRVPQWRDPGVRRDATAARGMRAFVRAAQGDAEGARRDAAAVHRDHAASADDLARVALAEAILIQRESEREALRDHVNRHRTLLYEHTHPRDREIVRAFDRMSRSTARAAYRQRAVDMPSASVGEEPPLAEWVGRIAPDAVLYLKGTGTAGTEAGAKIPSPRATPAGVAGMRAARGRRIGDVRGPLALFAWSSALGYVGFMIGAMLQPDDYGSSGTARLVFFTVLFALVPLVMRLADPVRARLRASHLRALGPAMSSLHRGDVKKAEVQLGELSESRHDVVAAQAHLTLAGLAERRGDLTTTLLHCDRGLRRLRREHAEREAGALVPDLMSLRALALAAMGLYEEARSELAHLPRTYAHRGLALFRTRLIELAVVGDTRAAAQWIDEHGGDLSLTQREELLIDAILALEDPGRVGPAELARLRDETTRASPTSKWLEAVAPDIAARIAGLAHESGARIELEAPADWTEIEAEREAEHDAEWRAAGAELARQTR